ncbi:MAG: arylsulfatase, partial [Planctomycetaceae bacterium]|nr:arylsulfatase [Planctomycetaceae bacterium]
VFDLLQDPQERYDVFMNNYTEHTWTMITFNAEIQDLMKTYIKYPPRKMQSEVYRGPLTLSEYQRFKFVRDSLKNEGISFPLPNGN